MIAGANPAAALPTLVCQSMRAVTLGVSCGSGPGLLPPPVSHANDGGGMRGIHDVSGDSDMLAHPAVIVAAASAHARPRNDASFRRSAGRGCRRGLRRRIACDGRRRRRGCRAWRAERIVLHLHVTAVRRLGVELRERRLVSGAGVGRASRRRERVAAQVGVHAVEGGRVLRVERGERRVVLLFVDLHLRQTVARDRPNNVVISATVAADGKILAGGSFTNIGGQSRSFFARLSNVAALQNLSVTQSSITWALGGSSPQLTRVSFEYSTDNVSYTALGDGAPTGSNWTLTGLDFPTGQDFYIRARGYYRSGNQNDSESIIASVRNAFVPEVPLVRAVSRKDHDGKAFDVNLPLTGSPGVECRSGGAGGDYQVIFSFANPITSVANASVTSGTGSVTSRMIDTDPHNYVVNLTGVNNAQVIAVTLTNVNDVAGNSSNSVSISMGVLFGDTSGNGSVNSSDVSQTKENADQAVNAPNFRTDVNASGNVTDADIGLVKSMSGTSLFPGAKP